MKEQQAYDVISNGSVMVLKGSPKTFERAIMVALKALRKQIPEKPTIKQLGDDIEVKCPACGDVHIFMDARKGYDYCHNCGKKYDWGK